MHRKVVVVVITVVIGIILLFHQNGFNQARVLLAAPMLTSNSTLGLFRCQVGVQAV